MQAQTVQQRSGAPWLALVLALLFAVAVVIGVQLAFRGEDTGTTTGPAIQSQVDPGVGQQLAGMSQAGVNGLDGTVPDQLWSSHRDRPPLTPAEAQRAQQLIRSSGEPDFLPAMARGVEVHGGRI
jgi:hypothetical protein